MSRDVFIIHSSQVDDRSLLVDGYYIAEAYPEEDVTTDMVTHGPFATLNEAREAILQAVQS